MDKSTKRRGKAEVGGEGEILEPHDSLTSAVHASMSQAISMTTVKGTHFVQSKLAQALVCYITEVMCGTRWVYVWGVRREGAHNPSLFQCFIQR